MEAQEVTTIGGVALSPQRARVAASLREAAAADTLAEWRAQGLEIAELRLDLMAEATLAAADALAAATPMPTILTARAGFEGGGYAGDEEARCALLTGVTGGDAVDIELAAPILPRVVAAAQAAERTVIVSRHNFAGADSAAQMDDGMAQALAAGADVFKYACLCLSEEALRTLEDFAARCRAAGRLCIVIGMDDGSGNPHAIAARERLPQAGSCLAFAAVQGESAPGQLGLAETVRACR